MKVTFEGEGCTTIELEWIPARRPSEFEDKRQDRFCDQVVRQACQTAIEERKFLDAKAERTVHEHPGGGATNRYPDTVC